MEKSSSKSAPKTPLIKDMTQYHQSTFTMTFAVEILGIDVWHDCNEGWLDLGPCTQGIKIQYQLYPGQSFDVDILIWPHAVKVWCGANSGWVRTWQFLDRRWLTFDIRHAFPVRVVELRNHLATVVPTLGLGSLSANAKNDKNTEVYLPPLAFGERRYFGSIQETDEMPLWKYILDLIWQRVESYIPASHLDGVFDVPQPVTDVRHQDAVLYYVRESILSQLIPEESLDTVQELEERTSLIERRGSKISKDFKKKPEPMKAKYEIKLSGDAILAGTGRLVPFESVGDRPAELGEVIVLISSNALPAPDDLPIFFVNIDTIYDVPVDEFKKLKITHIYTKWHIGDEEHSSELQMIKNKKELKFNDHHAVPMPRDMALEWISEHNDIRFQIQLRGLRQIPKKNDSAKFFGYDKKDRDFATMAPPKLQNEDTDVIIATTKIDIRSLTKGFNAMVRGDFNLYPPSVTVQTKGREAFCTNDINGIRAPMTPTIVVQPHIVLTAQMTLEVCMGYVGCRPHKTQRCYSRMFCLVSQTDAIMSILQQVTELNEEMTADMLNEELLTGFALDVGDTVIFYAEGRKDGTILKVWEKTEDFYPHAKPIFSTSSRYYSRLYPTLLNTAAPFVILKMCVPLSALLACPPVYARPVMPILTRTAMDISTSGASDVNFKTIKIELKDVRPKVVFIHNPKTWPKFHRKLFVFISRYTAALKFGRLLGGNLKEMPPRCDMPTAEELVSFRLELCVPPRPSHVLQSENPLLKNMPSGPLPHITKSSVSKINFTR